MTFTTWAVATTPTPKAPSWSTATWRGGDSEDLLAQAGVLFGRVCGCLRVQGLVHLGQDDLAQVEETWGEVGVGRWGWVCVWATSPGGRAGRRWGAGCLVPGRSSLPQSHLCWPGGT